MLSADFAAIILQQRNHNRIKIFKNHLNNKLISNNHFSFLKNKNCSSRALASKILKQYVKLDSGEESSQDSDNIDWNDALNLFDLNTDFIYDIIPREILDNIVDEVPQWYINFTNSEPTEATTPIEESNEQRSQEPKHSNDPIQTTNDEQNFFL